MQHGGHITKDLLGPRGVPVGGGGVPFENRVLALNPFRWYPLTDAVGSATAIEKITGLTYAVTNVTFGSPALHHNRTCAYFNGAAYINVTEAAFYAGFNKTEYTFVCWVKRDPAVTWADGNLRTFFVVATGTPGFHGTNIRKNNNNEFRFERSTSVSDFVQGAGLSGDTAVQIAGTVSVTANEMKGYIDAQQVGSTDDIDGTWDAGSARFSLIGAGNTTIFLMSGFISDVLVFNRALSQSELASLL